MEKQAYTTKDLQDMLGVGEMHAQRIMREIKSVSDTLRITGVVHVQDYEYWLKIRLGNQNKNVYDVGSPKRGANVRI